MKEWMATDLSKLDLLVIQIDGIHIKDDLMLLAAVGVDGKGGKHPLGVIEGATENAAVAQALLDNLIERGLDPKVCRLFVIDGAKALSKAIRKTFGRHTPIQRCQVHKARNIMERLPKSLHPLAQGVASGVGTSDAAKAEKLSRTLPAGWTTTLLASPPHSGRPGRNPDCQPPGLACRTAPLAGLHQHHREHERHDPPRLPQCQTLEGAAMALRWTGAAMLEAAKGFRRLKACKQLSALRAALAVHQTKHTMNSNIEDRARAA